MIRGTDGLDYEDLTAKLLGQPLKTPRNERIQALEGHSERFRREYLSIYDDWERHTPDERCWKVAEPYAHRAAYQHACIAAAEHDGKAGQSAREREAAAPIRV